MLAEDEDFGNGDRIEPALDPAPDGREERGGANNLSTQSAFFHASSQINVLTNILSNVSG